MAICSKCGVDIEQARFCPLCKTIVSEPEPPVAQAQPAPAAEEALPSSEFSMAGLTEQEFHGRQVVAAEVISVSMVMVAISVTVINFLLNRHLSWSLYILLSLGFAWIMVCIPIMFVKKPAIVLPVVISAPFAFLLLLDALSPPLAWALPLALPITAAVEVSIGAAVMATRLSKRHGLNVVAFGLLAATLICLVTDLVVGLYLAGTARLLWSAIVAFTTVPVAGFLIYFHHRIAKKTTLRKLFHL